MSAHDRLAKLFERRSHNPSYFAVRAALGTQATTELLDFCVPVNPYFPPLALVERIRLHLPEILKHYPDDAMRHQQAIGALEGLPEDCIVAANGSTEIITSLCRDLDGPLVTPVPTFGRWTDLPPEFGARVHTLQRREQAGFRVSVDELVRAAARTRAAAVVVCNPDNPTGACMQASEVHALIERLRDVPLVVIDESFIDFAAVEGAGRIALTTDNTVVVKSMGKALGWHGIRLGYAVAHPRLAQRLRAKLPYWNVNGLAAFVLQNLREFAPEYHASFARVAHDRRAMLERLSGVAGLKVFPSAANFVYARLERPGSGAELRTRLVERHAILVRECSNKIGATADHLRLAVLPPPAVERLASAMEDCIGGALVQCPRAAVGHLTP